MLWECSEEKAFTTEPLKSASLGEEERGASWEGRGRGRKMRKEGGKRERREEGEEEDVGGMM